MSTDVRITKQVYEDPRPANYFASFHARDHGGRPRLRVKKSLSSARIRGTTLG
jgi:hypothetical protein